MVRAGVIAHPAEWPYCGYGEIQQQKLRYSLIDFEQLLEQLGISSQVHLPQACCEQIEALLIQGQLERQSFWSESLAVGSEAYVRTVEKPLGSKTKGRLVNPALPDFS
jgi:putative transposase